METLKTSALLVAVSPVVLLVVVIPLLVMVFVVLAERVTRAVH